MSVVGDARQVRHLRAANKSWAVWTMNDDGGGDVFVVRERTNSISVIGGLLTDGTDFSERVIPVARTKIVNFHCLETAPNITTVIYDDGAQLSYFTYNVLTNTVLAPVTVLSEGIIPSQFDVGASLRQLYIRNSQIKVRSNFGPESTLVSSSNDEVRDMDVVRKALTTVGRYAGRHTIRRELALPFLSSASTVLLYASSTDSVAVTEALPPGVVSYWTFDTADFSVSNAVDVVSGNNASLVGAAPVSVAGQVGQAREFLSGTGTGYYNAGNPANLRITGQLSLSWWMRLTTLQNFHHPISKGFGGEYGTVINSDGSAYFYYGTFGGNGHGAPYFGYLLPAGTFKVGVWTHVAWTRDFVNKIVRCYIDGKLVLQKPTQGSAAAVSTGNVQLGQATSWTNSRFSGRLDDVIVANQAWSPQSVAALYAKGLSGIKANVSGSGTAQRLLDASGTGNHGVPFEPLLITARGLAVPVTRVSGRVVGVSSFTTPAALTIEARVVPRWNEAAERALFSNRAELADSSGGVRNAGGVELAFTPEGRIVFRFDTAAATVELRQTSGSLLRFNELNYIAVSHTFGAGGSTFIAINGEPVPAQWVAGSGGEVPALDARAGTVSINPGDMLEGLRISNVAKTITQIRDYLRGRS